MRWGWCLALAGVLFACTTSEPTVAEPVTGSTKPSKVLFIGNSFTYYNDSLHNHLRRLISAADVVGDKPRLRSMTLSGARLIEHAPAVASLVKSDEWDVVVLQGHSLEAFDPEARPGFRRAVRDFSQQIRAAGARPALFMTWAYADAPKMSGVIARHYGLAAAEVGALLVPVGLAFEQVTTEHPTIVLRQDDKRHPSLAGTYLAACVFYATLFQESPSGNAYHAGLSATTANILQRVAWEVVSDQ